MDTSVTGIAQFATEATNARLRDAIGVAVLKQAINAQALGAAALIESIAEVPQATALPDHLGTQIDVTA